MTSPKFSPADLRLYEQEAIVNRCSFIRMQMLMILQRALRN